MSDSERRAGPRAFPGLDSKLGPALPLSGADSEWLIERVVDRVLLREEKPRQRLLSLRALSLAALAVATSAAAATLVHQKLQRSADASAPAVSAPQRQNKKPAPWHAPPARVSEPGEDTALNTENVPSPEPALSSQVPSLTRGSASTVGSAPSAMSPAQEVAAVDELSQANDLRRKAQWRTAEAAYRGIAARYPQAREGTVAQLAAAELRLEHLGDAAGALRLYQSVPRSNALGVEALYGVSRAQHALGNRTEEAATLRALLDAYPTSLQADGARERLKRLSADSANP
jgi:hypothetical protein